MDEKPATPAPEPAERRAADGWVSTPLRGWAPFALLAPHVGLGFYLWLVPDGVSFMATQLALLAHVFLGLATLPVLAFFVWQHARRRLATAGLARVEVAHRRLGLLLTLAAALAVGSGAAALYWGEGTLGASLHLGFGVGLLAPLFLHVLFGKRPRARAVAASLLVVLAGGPAIARAVLATPAERPATPPFDFKTRPTALYDDAAWCGECHGEIYEEWRRSTHGRALVLPKVREEFTRFHREKGKAFPDNDLVTVKTAEPHSLGLCAHCHAPVSFYGDDPKPILTAPAPVADGVSCSFCHTLRGVRPAVRQPGFAGMGYYLTAPETVRRYIGQGSKNPILRALGNLLIRWRPELHRRDYHPPFLDRSEACQGCHGLFEAVTTYESWRTSRYNQGAASAKTVTCHDCHMVREMTGEPVAQPGPLVPWGRERPQRRTHLFLGGNVRALLHLQPKDGFDARDLELLARQRALARQGLSVRFESLRAEGGKVAARVVVRSERIGHIFPGMETTQRIGWVELRALSRSGEVLATTGEPPADFTRPSPSPTIYRADPAPERPNPPDTTIGAGGERAFDVALELGARRGDVAEIEAALRNSFDPEPIVSARRPFVGP